MSTTTDILADIDAHRESILGELQDYLRIPSVSTDPAHRADIERCATWLRDRFASAGLETRLIASERHPLVYAEWLQAGEHAPTLLFYGHYDVQPADPIEEWRHPPFEPTLEGERLVARGATDDKGQSYAHLAAVEACLRVRGALPVNVKFLIEGEEESGGESIERFVRADLGKLLACDAVVVSDSSMLGPGRPSLLYGLRGLLYTELRVRGPNRDLHSGSYGGAVTNPLNALAHMVSKLWDARTGRVLIPGFYDAVRPLEDWERREIAALPFDVEAYARDLGLTALFGEEGFTTHERTWARPTCDVNGIWGGYRGPGAKTVIAGSGGAKVSMRLVPDQDPEAIARELRAYVTAICPPGVVVELEVLHQAPPVLIDTQGPIAEAAMDAMGEVWGTRPLRVREGGSIPIVGTFAEVLRVPVLLLGFGLNDDRLHSPNEKIDLAQFFGGVRATARLLDSVAERCSKQPA
jgi:acetylornithine deacetylase/succinyl-diaminopimelate desuccinylase-like protein